MKRPGLIGLLAAVALSAAGLLYGVLGRGEAERVIEASGTVEATEAQLGFQVAGRIETIAAREGDRAAAGAELARLDRAEPEARRAQAVAQVAAAAALLEELASGFRPEEVAQARAALSAASQRLADARRDQERTQRLFDGGAVSREALEKAELSLELARSQFDQAAQQLRILETGPRRERIAAQRAQVAQAEAAVRQIDAALANTVIRAPFAGVVTVRHREPGETVAPGSPVLTIMNLDDRWVRIYVREDHIGAVRIGRRARITTDTYRDRTYGGEVVFISSEAEFTPRNVQTAEERVKLVYAVKVRISDDPLLDLKPGLPADVRLEPVDRGAGAR